MINKFFLRAPFDFAKIEWDADLETLAKAVCVRTEEQKRLYELMLPEEGCVVF